MSTISVAAGAEAPHPEDAARSEHTYNVGTRKSKLALKQTELVLTETVKAFPQYVFAVKAKDTAAGDIDKVTPFKDMPVKNIWTHELETLMVEGDLDFLVHSLKGRICTICAESKLTLYRRTHAIAIKLRDWCYIGPRGSTRCVCDQGR